MADKLLKSIKFPTLPDRYVIGDSTLTEEGAAADAKATGDEIINLKSALNHLIIESSPENVSGFVQGWIRADGTWGTSGEPIAFCRTGFIQLSGEINVFVKEGYLAEVAEYTASNVGTYVGRVLNYFTGTQKYTFDDAKYYCIQVKKSDGSDFDVSTLPSDTVSYIRISYTDITLTKSGKPADAKIVGDELTKTNENVSNIKEDITPLIGLSEGYYLYNIFNDVTFDTGLYNKNGSYSGNASCKHTNRIPVREGDCIIVEALHEARVVTAYLNGVANESLGAEYTSRYIVPANVDEIIMSFGLANVPASEIWKNTKDKIPALSEYWYSTNLLDTSALKDGSVNKNGSISSGSTYKYTDYILVNEGDVLKGIYSTDIRADQSDTFRVVTAYDVNKVPISAKGAEEVSAYTVPEGVACVRITIYASKLSADYRIVKNQYYPFEPYSKTLKPMGAGENERSNYNIMNRPLSNLPDYVTNALSYRPVGKLSRPYICLTSDDGAHELATYTVPMLISKQVSATLYLMKDSLVFDDPTEKATIIDAIENHGFELGQHGGRSWLNTDELALNDFFDNETAFFDTLGLSAKSAACPGGYSTPMIDALAGGRFGAHCNGYGDTETKYYPYYCIGARSNLYGLTRVGIFDFTLEENKERLDYAIAHNLIYCVYWHDNVIDNSKKAILEGLIDYAKTQNVTFCNIGEIASLEQID